MRFLFSVLLASVFFFPASTFAASGVCVVQNAQKYVNNDVVTQITNTPCDSTQECDTVWDSMCTAPNAAFKNDAACKTKLSSVCQPNTTPNANVTTPAASGPNIGRYGYRDPLGGLNLPTLIGGAIRTILGIVGALFLLMFLYGGFLWMTAGGDGKRVEKSKETLKNAVFGMIIIMLSSTLVHLVLNFAATVPK